MYERKIMSDLLAWKGSASEFEPYSDSGETTVIFAFDATGIAGHDLVAYETLKDAAGEVVAVHQDINDAAQTVHVAEAGVPASGKAMAKTGSVAEGPWPAALAIILSCTGVLVIAAARRRLAG